MKTQKVEKTERLKDRKMKTQYVEKTERLKDRKRERL